MQKENYTVLLGLEILFLSFFATSLCLSFDLWQPAGGTLPIDGCEVWGDHPDDLEKPVLWTQTLRDYYSIPLIDNPWRMVRLILSVFPWTFFGLAICHVVYTHAMENRLIDPFSAGLTAAKELLPFWLAGAVFVGFTIGLAIVYKLHPDYGNPFRANLTFYLFVIGFGIAFLVNLAFLAMRFANDAYLNRQPDENEKPVPKLIWKLRWILWKAFEGLLAAVFAYIPMLIIAILLHHIICFMVFGTHPWIPMRKEDASLAALSFIPLVVLNGFFWTVMTRMYIKIHAATK